ncbi:MAG: hypothetical protein NXI04_26665 [Planctomycetaceae bacterium]|nr:hypothetical protein [Planctomycetaceae bacterium]
MKTLTRNLTLLALILTSAVQAGDCRLGHFDYLPSCEIRPICHPPVIRPCVRPAHVIQPRCRIRVCEIQPACRITVCPQPVCHRCGGEICTCHTRPSCRISVCEPTPCRIVCHPVSHCRIRPVHPVDPILPEPILPGYADAPVPGDPPIAPPAPGLGQPAAPAPPSEQLPQVTPGQQVSIEGSRLGVQPGVVSLSVAGLQLQARVISWTETKVDAVIPQLPLSAAATAQVAVVNAQGQVADQLDVLLVPAVTVPQELAQR